MSVSSQLKSRIIQYRPSGASAAEISRLVKLAAAWFDRLEPALRNIKADAFILTKDQRLELALAMTELADDLHADSGIWRALESSNLPQVAPARVTPGTAVKLAATTPRG